MLPPGAAQILLRALFLASSWTWCIGMFLPVLLVRDFGLASFWVFALPNVIGAAAMGFTLARPGTSEAFIREHARACEVFSAITLAFQVFFLTWLFLSEPDGSVALTGAIAVLLGASFWVPRLRGRLFGIAVLVWGLSALAAVGAMVGADPETAPRPPYPLGEQSSLDLWMLAPVCLFGFALCPYLDLTFHRARQGLSPGGSRWAFALGFGLFFFAMIGFTAWYAPWLALGEGRPALGMLAPISAVAVTAHITLQALFTARVHERELCEARDPGGLPMRALAIGFGGALGILAGVGGNGDAPGWMHVGAPVGEVLYRTFMSFYGLAFPAYLWVVAIPGRFAPGDVPARRRRMRLYWATILAASPFYAVGFIGHEEPWLLAGLGLVLLSGFAARRGEPVSRPTPGSAAPSSPASNV